MNTNSELVITTGTTNVMLAADPQQDPIATSHNIQVDGTLRGGGTILVRNADNITSPDGSQGVRFRGTGASDYTGTIIVTNNSKTELQVSGSGPFSPVGTGKFQLYCGQYDGNGALTAPGTGGYLEFNVRNNNTNGDTVIGTDLELLGNPGPGFFNAVVINSLGSAPNGSVATMGNLRIGDNQELIGYKAASSATNGVKFSSVTLTGGNATFSPHSSSFGVARQAGTFFILNNVTQSTPSGITMNGLDTLTLTGTSSFSGGVSVQQGKVLLNGILNGSGITNNGGTVGGNGTNNSAVQIFGNLAPGDVGKAGTFGASSLFLSGPLLFDIGANTTVGGGVNDLVQVNGDISLGNMMTVNPLTATPQAGTYRVINYTGNSGGSQFAGDPQPVGRVQFHLDYGTAHQVNLVVSGGPAVARWVSTGDGTWDQQGAQNWATNLSSTTPDTQFQLNDYPLFDDLVSGVQTNLTLNTTVNSGGLTNNSSANSYSITGTGRIAGFGGLTKTGSSTLTLGTSNDFTGNVAIRGGTVKVGTFQSLGAGTNAVVINNGGTLDLGGIGAANVANGFGARPFLISGAGVGSGGAIINSSANLNQQNAFQNITLTGNAAFGGDSRWDLRGGTPGPVLDLAGFKLTKTGSNQISLVAASDHLRRHRY